MSPSVYRLPHPPDAVEEAWWLSTPGPRSQGGCLTSQSGRRPGPGWIHLSCEEQGRIPGSESHPFRTRWGVKWRLHGLCGVMHCCEGGIWGTGRQRSDCDMTLWNEFQDNHFYAMHPASHTVKCGYLDNRCIKLHEISYIRHINELMNELCHHAIGITTCPLSFP